MKGLDTLKWFGLGLAVTLLLFFAGLRVPVAGLVVLPLVIFPALYVGVRAGKQAGLLLPAAAVVFVFAMAGLEAAAAYLVFALVTFLLFFSFGRGWSIATMMSGNAICTVAVMLVVATAFAGSLSTLWTTLNAGAHAQVLATLEVYQRMGLSGETIEFLREQAEQMAALFVQMLPAMIFFAIGVAVLVNLGLLSWQFPQYRSFFFEAGDLKEWKSPDHMVWLMLVPALALFLPLGWTLRTLGMNVVFVCAVFYFFHGLAIVAYYFDYKKVPMFFRVLGYLLIVFEQILTVLVIGLGFFDLWGDFRRLKRRTAGQA
jgi:hypothetical protein